jgi:2-methylcitrate dehydratase PrpD
MTTSITEELAGRISEMSFDSLTKEVIEEAKYRLLDIIAVTVPAWEREKSAQIARDYAQLYGSGLQEATLMKVGSRVSAPMAAFANGVAGHSLELDDDHNTMVGHPGVPVVPAIIAAAERENSSGRDLILATIIGYDVVIRTAQAVKAGVLHHTGFHPTGTNGVFGATAGVSKIMALDVPTMVNAFGIAGSESSGLIQAVNEGVMTKRFHAGWAAHNGVTAATLAQLGYTGPRMVLEGDHGWYHAYAGEGTYDLDIIMKDWGTFFEIENTAWKPYACNRYSHGPIDCAFDIRRQLNNTVNVDEIASVEVGTYQEALEFTAGPEKVVPRNTFDAQFSTYFAVAVSMLTGRALLDEFSDEKVADPEVLALARKVTVIADPELQPLYPKLYPARIILTMKDGRTFRAMVRTPKGDPEWTLTREELRERFRTLAGRVYPQERVEQIVEVVTSLEQLERVPELLALLAS